MLYYLGFAFGKTLQHATDPPTGQHLVEEIDKNRKNSGPTATVLLAQCSFANVFSDFEEGATNSLATSGFSPEMLMDGWLLNAKDLGSIDLGSSFKDAKVEDSLLAGGQFGGNDFQQQRHDVRAEVDY